MPTKIYISGNFLIAEDAVSREQYFKVKTAVVYHLRDPSDIFAFFNEGVAPKTEGSPQIFQLGVQNSWAWNSPDLVQTSQTNFEFDEILDGNGFPYASADILDQYFNDNLGSCSSATVIVNGKHSELILDDGTNPHGTTQSDVGLSNVDNTSDIDKPISTLTQTALDGKVESVTGLNTDNIDPINPIVKVSVDGVTITGQGTPADPLVSASGQEKLIAQWYAYDMSVAGNYSWNSINVFPTTLTTINESYRAMEFAGVGGADGCFMGASLPSYYPSGSSIKVTINFTTDGTGGSVKFFIGLQKVNGVNYGDDTTTEWKFFTFNATAGLPSGSNSLIFSGVGINALRPLSLKVFRDPGDANDTYNGEAYITNLLMEIT